MPRDDDTQATWGPVGARLRAPGLTLTPDGFARSLVMRRLHVRLAGLGAAAGDAGLLGRIRGAFGQILAEAASPEAAAGRPCPWSPPCAFEALFRKQGRMNPGLDFPAPWILAAEARRGGDLAVTLTIFGFAGEWMPAAAEALSAALAHRVDWAGTTGLFCPRPVILARNLTVHEGLAPGSEAPEGLELDMLTPLVSTGRGAHLDPAAPFLMLRHRLDGLARWQGATISEAEMADLTGCLRRLTFAWLDAEPIAWTRGSRRQDREIPMRGVVGRLAVDGDSADLARALPVFRLGEAAHAGADIAFGCGRYRLRIL